MLVFRLKFNECHPFQAEFNCKINGINAEKDPGASSTKMVYCIFCQYSSLALHFVSQAIKHLSISIPDT